jgi:hypothetical protein
VEVEMRIRLPKLLSVIAALMLLAAVPAFAEGPDGCKMCDGYSSGGWSFTYCGHPPDLGAGEEECDVQCGDACPSCIGGGWGGQNCFCQTYGDWCLYTVVEG